MHDKTLLVALSAGSASGAAAADPVSGLPALVPDWKIVEAPAGSLEDDEFLLEKIEELDAILLGECGGIGDACVAACGEGRICAILLCDPPSCPEPPERLVASPFCRILEDDPCRPADIARAAMGLWNLREQVEAMQKDFSGEGERILRLFYALPDIVYVLDQNGYFIFVNAAAATIGYSPESLIGMHFTEILAEDDRERVSRKSVLSRIRSEENPPATPPKLFDERRSGERMTRGLEVRIPNRKTGETVYALVNAYGEHGGGLAFSEILPTGGPLTLGVIHDITASKLYEKSLEDSLAAKETQLRETHRRVKNNLQMVASLIHLRASELSGEEMRAFLDELITQIQSMAMVHEALFQTENPQGADAESYFRRFSQLMEQNYGHVGSAVRLETKAEACIVDAETLSYSAMLASELVLHVYGHDFAPGASGRISLTFSRVPPHYLLEIWSDGGMESLESLKSSISVQIAQALTGQLSGKLEIDGSGGKRIRAIVPIRGEDG